jgi:hypothetical protein
MTPDEHSDPIGSKHESPQGAKGPTNTRTTFTLREPSSIVENLEQAEDRSASCLSGLANAQDVVGPDDVPVVLPQLFDCVGQVHPMTDDLEWVAGPGRSSAVGTTRCQRWPYRRGDWLLPEPIQTTLYPSIVSHRF